jgi:phenylalanyl-tRNA synthetase alpha chain
MQGPSINLENAEQSIAAAASLDALDHVRVALLGKSGLVTEQLKALGKLAPDERKARGAEINALKERYTAAVAERKATLEQVALEAQLAGERGRRDHAGARRRARQRAPDHAHAGADRGDLRTARLPRGHRSRDRGRLPQLRGAEFPAAPPGARHARHVLFPDGRLLRTHTSPVQIRAMKGGKPPLRVIAPGKVYRSDSDQTHSPMFHQVEGLFVAEGVSFADLKGTLAQFVAAFFERDFEMRFRPSYFPFTEPSAEVDIRWERADGTSSWLEVLGCGMVHPNVLRECGIDAERYTGFAFGMGVERFAMLRYGVTDLRAFFENDLAFLRQFA